LDREGSIGIGHGKIVVEGDDLKGDRTPLVGF
jgi:hypothetical protein